MKREIYPLFDGTFWLADELAHNNKPNGYAVTKERKEGGGGQHESSLEFILFISFAKICMGITLAQSYKSYGKNIKDIQIQQAEKGQEGRGEGRREG